MLKHLRIEWMKIKNYRVFQVFSILYIIGILAIIYIFYRVYLEIIGNITESISGKESRGSDFFNLFGEENIWLTVCFSTSFLLYLPGMVIINLFTNEVNFKTHRQNIIDGWKRETFIYSKIALIACISLVVALVNLIAVLIMCNITGTTFSFAGIGTLGLCFLQTFIYLMFALTLATLFRRSGIAIIVFFVYGLLLEFLFIWLFNKAVPGMGHFLPLQVADSLIPFPRARESGLYSTLPSTGVMAVAAIVVAGLYVLLAVRKYKNDDL